MSDGAQINLICCTSVICNEVAQGVTLKSVALTYAMAIKSEHQGADSPDWKAINSAIMGKWGMRGLVRLKNKAWRIYEGKEAPGGTRQMPRGVT